MSVLLEDAGIPKGAERWGKITTNPEEEVFLQGPHGRGFELLRAIKIFTELIHGFRALHFVGPCVTVFGSARFDEQSPYYALTQRGTQKGGERAASAR